MEYNTETKRRRLSYEILSGFKERDTERENMSKQAAMICKNYLLSDCGEDAATREKAISCSKVISGALSELQYLDTRYNLDRSTGVNRWIELERIDIRDYVPPIIDHIEDNNGNKISSYCYEFRPIVDLLSTYNYYHPRSEMLNGGELYDDDYIRKRVIVEEHKKYGRVVDGVDVGRTGRVHDVYHKDVVVDSSISERETDPNPRLPSPERFDDMLVETGEPGGVYNQLMVLSNVKRMKENPQIEDYFDKLGISYEWSQNNRDLIIHDEGMTLEFVDRVANTIPKYLYYEIDGTNFFMVMVDSKTTIKIDPLTRQEFESPYKKASDRTRFFVYDNKDLAHIYNNYKYKLKLRLVPVCGNPDAKYHKVVVTPTGNVNDNAYQKMCSDARTFLIGEMERAKRAFENLDKSIRCEDDNPIARYDSFCQILTQSKPINVQQCNIMIDYCSTELLRWINRRIRDLKNSATDSDNAYIMIQLLNKRLVKGDGSVLNWYQTAMQFDGTYKKHVISGSINKKLTKYGLVCKAYEDPYEDMFNNKVSPKYIDIQDEDEVYRTRFNVGDTVYIINDIDEQTNTIEDITYIKVPTYDNVDVSNIQDSGFTGNIGGVKLVKRLILKLPLKRWCNSKDISDIRVLKLLH